MLTWCAQTTLLMSQMYLKTVFFFDKGQETNPLFSWLSFNLLKPTLLIYWTDIITRQPSCALTKKLCPAAAKNIWEVSQWKGELHWRTNRCNNPIHRYIPNTVIGNTLPLWISAICDERSNKTTKPEYNVCFELRTLDSGQLWRNFWRGVSKLFFWFRILSEEKKSYSGKYFIGWQCLRVFGHYPLWIEEQVYRCSIFSDRIKLNRDCGSSHELCFLLCLFCDRMFVSYV